MSFYISILVIFILCCNTGHLSQYYCLYKTRIHRKIKLNLKDQFATNNKGIKCYLYCSEWIKFIKENYLALMSLKNI